MEYLRTYFWHDRVIPSWLLKVRRGFRLSPSTYFQLGNAGDLMARRLIEFEYGMKCLNTNKPGSRLLTVGSIAHKILKGDVLCGIGVKDPDLFSPSLEEVEIYGLRGPLSYEVFKRRGFDLKKIKFLMDPGLLLRFIIGDVVVPGQDRVIFIPHYRERFNRQNIPQREIKMVDVDCEPTDLATEILKSKLVYSSSLHGIIFAHALNRPCIFVRPQTNESLFKYSDYYESMDLKSPKPLPSIHHADFIRDSDTPPSLKYKRENFYFPAINELRERGILGST